MQQTVFMTTPRAVRRGVSPVIAGLLDDAQAWASGQVSSYVDGQKNDLQARAGQVATNAAGAAGAQIARAVGQKMIWIAGAIVIAPLLAVVVWQLAKRYKGRASS